MSSCLSQLPYACYSSTQVVTPPAMSRAASLEGGGSPYSSCTYQSIEGLTHNSSGAPMCQRMYQCGNCGIESSASSVTSNYARPKRCGHGTFIPRPPRRVRRYIPDYYGWVSPPHSPPYQTQQILIPESVSGSASVYGGSVRSDPGGIPQVVDANESSGANSRQSINSIYSPNQRMIAITSINNNNPNHHNNTIATSTSITINNVGQTTNNNNEPSNGSVVGSLPATSCGSGQRQQGKPLTQTSTTQTSAAGSPDSSVVDGISGGGGGEGTSDVASYGSCGEGEAPLYATGCDRQTKL